MRPPMMRCRLPSVERCLDPRWWACVLLERERCSDDAASIWMSFTPRTAKASDSLCAAEARQGQAQKELLVTE